MAKRRRRRRGVAAAFLGAALTAALAAAEGSGGRASGEFDADDMPAANAAYKQADARIDAARAAYRRAVVPLLRSPDPFRRRLALERLRAGYNWALFDRDMQEALLPILEETALLPSETCAREPARCGEEPAVSNGMLAARLRRSDVAPELFIAYVVAHPAAVDALIAAGVAQSDVGRPLAAAKTPAVQAALLRLALASTCVYPSAPPAVVALVDSPDVTVRRLAALAMVRFTSCRGSSPSEHDAIRKRAIAAVAARFDDPADAQVLTDCARIGDAAEAFIPQLVARLERQPRDDRQRRQVLQVFARMNEYARLKKEAIAALYRVLLDPAQRSLHAPALTGLLALWPHSAPEAKPALLALVDAEPELFTKGIALLHGWGARLTAGEHAHLAAIYRRGCISDDGEACSWQSLTLRYLASDSHLPFQPLGRAGEYAIKNAPSENAGAASPVIHSRHGP